MDKIIIHHLRITQKLEKQLFQILLPENAIAITGIAVTVDKHVVKVGFESINNMMIGMIHLKNADVGDRFFAQDVHALNEPPEYEITGESFPYTKSYFRITFPEMLETYQPVTSTILDGFYEDTATGGDGGASYGSYNVRIYLQLKMPKP